MLLHQNTFLKLFSAGASWVNSLLLNHAQRSRSKLQDWTEQGFTSLRFTKHFPGRALCEGNSPAWDAWRSQHIRDHSSNQELSWPWQRKYVNHTKPDITKYVCLAMTKAHTPTLDYIHGIKGCFLCSFFLLVKLCMFWYLWTYICMIIRSEWIHPKIYIWRLVPQSTPL